MFDKRMAPAHRRSWRPRSSHLLILLTVFILFLLFGGMPSSETVARLHLPTGARHTNTTLGFGGVYVVSGPGSPRRVRIEEAAAVTEIQLTIPDQRIWTDEDLAHFQREDRSKSGMGEGSMKAWLSHHLVLRAFLETNQETALILEDDVDWDIRLRTMQIPLAQHAARSLFPSARNANRDQYPWGGAEDWDLLYLGHCGDYLDDIEKGVGVGYSHPEDLQTMEHVLFADPTLPAITDLHHYTASLFTAFQIQDRTRLLHRSKWPLCTFGYAVTRVTAERLLNDLAPAHEAEENPITAFDAAILTACRDGPLRCYTFQPEFFHHQQGKSIINTMENKTTTPPVDERGYKQTLYRGETANIDCGFWSGHFYFDGDPGKLQWLQQEVARKGQCLKEGRIIH